MSRRLRFQPVEMIARAGYAARGVVYLLIGGFAVQAALELRSRALGAEDALQAFVEWPLGPVWLVAVAAGLAGFVLWRLLQAVLDADRRGSKPADLFFRAGQGFSALLYGVMAWSALNALDGVGDIREGEDGEDSVAAVLALPLGEALVLAGAVVIAGAAIGNLAKAVSKDFGEELICSKGVRSWAMPMGRIGYAARGVVFAGVALILAQLGFDLAAAGDGTLGSTLQQLERLPFGSTLLVFTGLALAAFGLFGLVEARWRRIRVPEELQPDRR